MSRFDISDSSSDLFATAGPFVPMNVLLSPDGPAPSQNVANFSRLVSLPEGVTGSEDPRIHWLKEKARNLKKVSDPSDHSSIDKLIDGEIKNTEEEYANRTEPANAFESTRYEGHTRELSLIFFPGTLGFSPEYNSVRFNGPLAIYAGAEWRGSRVIGSIRRSMEDPVTGDFASSAAGYVSQLHGAAEGVMADHDPEERLVDVRYTDATHMRVEEAPVEANRDVRPAASVGVAGPPVHLGAPQVTQIEIDEEEAGQAALIAEEFAQEAAAADDDELRQEREDLRREAQEISNTLVRRVIATRERESGTTARLPEPNVTTAPAAPPMDNERGLNRSFAARVLAPQSVKEKVAVGLLTLGAAALYGVFSLYT